MEDDYEVDAEQLGVATALERTCVLEARLRQAIQGTHPRSGGLQLDGEAADRERDALLTVTEQLELLEEKLREYRALGQHDYDEKTAVLSQLDSLRRELIAISHGSLPQVVFAKDAVRDVRDFAEMRGDDESGSEEEEEPNEQAEQDATPSSGTASPSRPEYASAHSTGQAAAKKALGAQLADAVNPLKLQEATAWQQHQADGHWQADVADRILLGGGGGGGLSPNSSVADRILAGGPRGGGRGGGDAAGAGRAEQGSAAPRGSFPSGAVPGRDLHKDSAAGRAGSPEGSDSHSPWRTPEPHKERWRPSHTPAARDDCAEAAAPLTPPAALRPREPAASPTVDDDRQFGGRVDVQSFSGKGRPQADIEEPRTLFPTKPRVTDTSSRASDSSDMDDASRRAVRGSEAGTLPQEIPPRFRRAATALFGALAGAAAVLLLGGNLPDDAVPQALKQCTAASAKEPVAAMLQPGAQRRAHPLGPPPDVNLGRG